MLLVELSPTWIRAPLIYYGWLIMGRFMNWSGPVLWNDNLVHLRQIERIIMLMVEL